MGHCAWKELQPQKKCTGGDVVLIVKESMSSPEPLHCIVLIPEAEAAAMRAGLQQPTGSAERRPIGHNVVKNIQRHRLSWGLLAFQRHSVRFFEVSCRLVNRP